MQPKAPIGAFLFAALFSMASAFGAEPSLTGQTGLISMPDARFAPEGSWRSGYSYLKPYSAIWSGVTFFPWIEGSFLFTRIMHIPGFPETTDPSNPLFGADYGDFKDKSFDTKLRLLRDRDWWPQISLGAQDIQGTGIFKAAYGVASKQVGEVDLTLGYGNGRID